jgi:hypothetical protein
MKIRHALLLALLAAACSKDPTGPALQSCGTDPVFTVLPVALADIDAIVVIGGLGAPGHTLPTAHAGIYIANEGALVAAPGDMQITNIRRTRYLVSPTRQGHEDYTVEFSSCREISGWFGHITTLDASFSSASLAWRNCETYSTSVETIESCHASPRGLRLEAGDPLGTTGFSIALGLMGLDVGVRDSRVEHFYAAPWRHPGPTFDAVCPWDQFTPALRTQLFDKLADKGRPGVTPAGNPRCGTMEVDVAGTAKGVWAETGITTPVAGDETRYITLANYPYRPEDHLALSLGPAALGAMVAVVPRAASGRVNRAFEDVTPDGLIYCYGPDAMLPTSSWLLTMTGPAALTIRQVTHSAGASPCLADPSGWSTAGGVAMVR